MDDLISRQAAIDALKRKQDDGKGDLSRFYNTIIQHDIEAIMQLPPIQPEPQYKTDYGFMWLCPKCGLPVHSDYTKCVRCGHNREKGV